MLVNVYLAFKYQDIIKYRTQTKHSVVLVALMIIDDNISKIKLTPKKLSRLRMLRTSKNLLLTNFV